MSNIKHYVVGREEERDFYVDEIIRRHDAISTMWGVDTGKILYDAVSPLMGQLMDCMHDLALFNSHEYDPYGAACQCLGHEITDCLVAEHIRREHSTRKLN